jgi:hypothetical protein
MSRRITLGMSYTISIVYPLLVDDGQGDTAMQSEPQSTPYETVEAAELAGMLSLRRLRAEGKKPAHYLVFDESGGRVPPADQIA